MKWAIETNENKMFDPNSFSSHWWVFLFRILKKSWKFSYHWKRQIKNLKKTFYFFIFEEFSFLHLKNSTMKISPFGPKLFTNIQFNEFHFFFKSEWLFQLYHSFLFELNPIYNFNSNLKWIINIFIKSILRRFTEMKVYEKLIFLP